MNRAFMPSIAGLLVLAPLASAQQPPATTPAPAQAPSAPTTAESPALSGPRVPETPAAPGLVTRDFNGQVRRPETTPEEAALALLDLDAPARAAVRAIIEKRDAIIDRFVGENLDLLTKFGAAAGANDKLDQLGLGLEAFQKLAPLREGGSLWEQIAAALPQAPAEKFNALMKDYWDAIAEEGKRTPNEKGKPRGRFEIVAAERIAILGREIESSFNRLLYSGGLIVSYFAKDLDLTDTQKARVRQMTLDFARRTNLKPTEKDQQGLVVELLSILTEEQRVKVTKKLGI